ncbi:GGDEF domain-containing protein [Chromobacterium sp. S0633]|uniref:GGDEF domain-containing protein n=1 Tax=Chromobacterium sp. S0633 TaxID=2957805 RepID=UPI00209D3D5F|nr:GGDEF domain-containing protein [Chromobacterium sp. S0633]MCP1289490.1 GGDEF domain-containing protein [Chromobacterium sp. S0633]
MQSILDFQATVLSTTGYGLVLTAVITMFWLRNRDERAFLYFCAAGVCVSLGGVFSLLPIGLPPWPQLVFNNLLWMLFHPVALCGIRHLNGKRPRVWQSLLLTAAGMSAYILAGPADMGRRTAAVCLVYLIAWLLAARELWPGHSRIGGAGRKMALTVCLLYALLALARIVHAGWTGEVYDADAMRFTMLSSLGMHWLSFSFILCALYICYERALERTQHQASHDGLTNLLNQRRFRELAEAACRRAWRERKPLALLLLDVDHFKSINDRYGHQCGDLVLQQLAACLRAEAGRDDIVGRYGGEEFVMLLPRTGLEDAHAAAQRILRAVDALRPQPAAAAPPLRVSVSIGVASTSQQPYDGLSSLFRAADGQLYRAKRNGRNRIELAEGQYAVGNFSRA